MRKERSLSISWMGPLLCGSFLGHACPIVATGFPSYDHMHISPLTELVQNKEGA